MRRTTLFPLFALFIFMPWGSGLAQDGFRPFELSFWVYGKPGQLPKPSPKLQVLLPSDFEVVDFRTGNGGPFYGRREEIDDLQHQVREPQLVKGVFQIMDIVRVQPREAPLFDRSTNRFLFETKPREELKGLNFTVESLHRADTASFPILLVKAKFPGSVSIYSLNLVLPDDAFVTITYWMPRPPTKLNEEIWDRFIVSIREL
jgi:hypothetical protein